MASGLILLSVIAAAGAVAGVVSGLLGIGGGIILVPALLYVFGAMGYHFDQIMQVCVATSTGTIIFNSLRAIHGHSKRGAVDFGLMRSWGPFIAIGSVLGVLVATALHSRELQLVFGCIGFALGLYMAFGRRDWRISDVLPGPGLRSVYASLIGFFSAIMGIGGGSFTVPLLSAYSVPPHRAVATSSGFGLLISIPAFVAFLASGWGLEGRPPYTLGYVNLPAVALITLASTLTVPLGVKLAHRLSPAQLRGVFACTILVLAGNMLRKALIG